MRISNGAAAILNLLLPSASVPALPSPTSCCRLSCINFGIPTAIRRFVSRSIPRGTTRKNCLPAKSTSPSSKGRLPITVSRRALFPRLPSPQYARLTTLLRFPLTPRSLACETLLLREKGSSVRDVFDSALMLHGLVCEPAWTSVDSQALIHAAQNGFGIAILPELLVAEELGSGKLIRLDVRDMHLKNTNYTVYHREKHLSPPLRGFLSIAGQADML